ncbi:hypothetical protein ABIB25_004965 [Nakamurella sp. UYEF19]|uniref:RICIN domain-containing protein n=1 Tax=Nakamurella sp. UYEF19 TaxID=1756392 RepID=UPI0033926048
MIRRPCAGSARNAAGRPRRGRSLITLLVAFLAVVAAMVAPAASASADTPRVEITNSFSGLKADVVGASTDPMQPVFLWPDNTSASQEFNLLDSGGGWFRIQARHSGQCLMLDWRWGNYVNGTGIVQYPACAAGYAPAEWSKRYLSGTTCNDDYCTTGIDQMVLVNRRTGKCLDVSNSAGGRPPARSYLQQWDCVSDTKAWNIGNQAWDIGSPGSVRID